MRIWLSVPFLLLALVVGCDKDGDKKAPTQVAAQVNGDEITIHQVNSVLARTPNVNPELAPKAKREILDRLVNQELARQQAIEKKLDRTPFVMQAIESAKIDILARAYLEQVAASQPKPTQEEARKYYQAHPELFAQRRIFHVEEIIVRADDDMTQRLREQLATARSLQGMAAWLKSQGAQFAQNERIVAAEEVPLASLRTLHEAKPGEIQLHQSAGRVSLFRVVSAKPAPVDEAAAMPRIQQFLFSQRANDAVTKEMKRMRDTAEVTYLGEFAVDAQDKEAITSPSVSAPRPGDPAPTQGASSPAAEQNFDKGLRGLK